MDMGCYVISVIWRQVAQILSICTHTGNIKSWGITVHTPHGCCADTFWYSLKIALNWLYNNTRKWECLWWIQYDTFKEYLSVLIQMATLSLQTVIWQKSRFSRDRLKILQSIAVLDEIFLNIKIVMYVSFANFTSQISTSGFVYFCRTSTIIYFQKFIKN